jgi:kumamolisin
MVARLLGVIVVATWFALAAGCKHEPKADGIRRASSVYDDGGPAPEDVRVRALFSLKLRDRAALDALVERIYDPSSPDFHRFTSVDDLAARFTPTEDDLASVKAWAEGHGLEVARVTRNRLLVEVSGTVPAFNAALGAELHVYTHKKNKTHVLGTPEGIRMPDASAIDALASLDVGIDAMAPPDTATSKPGAVPALGLRPAMIATSYGLDRLAAQSERGKGASIGIVTGGEARMGDIHAFWDAFDVHRAEPVVVDLMEPPPSRVFEATFDVEWAGVLAPEANLVVYQAPDSRTTSLLFAFTEAATRGEVGVVTDSYAHRESSEPDATRGLYDLGAELAAAIGTTVVAASGDTGEPDLPATCPFVTAVGGTTLTLDASGTPHEEAWERSGAGFSSFPTPRWQRGVLGDASNRAVADVALNSGAEYVAVYSGEWRPTAGTSVAAPVFAAILAVVNGARLRADRRAVGFLNAALYGDADVRGTFRDITSGGTAEFAAAPGWDVPTGWGAPNAEALLRVLK